MYKCPYRSPNRYTRTTIAIGHYKNDIYILSHPCEASTASPCLSLLILFASHPLRFSSSSLLILFTSQPSPPSSPSSSAPEQSNTTQKPLLIARINLSQKVVRSIARAVETLLAESRLGKVAVVACEIRHHVLVARHVRRRVEAEELVVGAVDGRAGEGGGQQAFGDLLEGVDSVHEDPEAGEFFGGCDHTGEGLLAVARAGMHGRKNVPGKSKHQDEESVVDGSCGVRSLESGDDHVPKSTREHHEDPDEEEGAGATAVKISSDDSILLEADWVVPAEEAQDTHQL
jgi:hypothetical protein